MDNSVLIDYTRQAQMDEDLGRLQNYRTSNIHIIIGCGGIGFWLGIQLAMLGCDNFILFDGDKIEKSNLNRIPVPPLWVGHNKAVALRKMIMFLRPDAKVKTYSFHIKDESMPMLEELLDRGVWVTRRKYVWDTTDNAVDQKKIVKMCKGKKNITISYRKIGYEGFGIGTYKNYDVWLDPVTYAPGYRTTRANSITSSVAAGIGIFAEFLGQGEDVSIDLRGLVTKKRAVVKKPVAGAAIASVVA